MGHPLVEECEMRRESLLHFLFSDSKGRAVLVGNQVINGQEVHVPLEPAENSVHVLISAGGVNGTKERVFEQPVELPRSGIGEKIQLLEGGLRSGFARFLA